MTRLVVQVRLVSDEQRARWKAAAGSLGVSEWLRRLGDAACVEGGTEEMAGRPLAPVVSNVLREAAAKPAAVPAKPRLTPDEILAQVRAASRGDLSLGGRPDPRRR